MRVFYFVPPFGSTPGVWSLTFILASALFLSFTGSLIFIPADHSAVTGTADVALVSEKPMIPPKSIIVHQSTRIYHIRAPKFSAHNSLNVASELSALPPYSNIVLLAQLLPSAALSVHAGSQ